MSRKEKKWPLYVMRVIAIVCLAAFLYGIAVNLWSQAQINRMLEGTASPPAPLPPIRS